MMTWSAAAGTATGGEGVRAEILGQGANTAQVAGGGNEQEGGEGTADPVATARWHPWK